MLTPRPVRINDPGEYTVQAILDHAAWLTEAPAAKVAAIRLGRGGDSMLVRVARKAIPRGNRVEVVRTLETLPDAARDDFGRIGRLCRRTEPREGKRRGTSAVLGGADVRHGGRRGADRPEATGARWSTSGDSTMVELSAQRVDVHHGGLGGHGGHGGRRSAGAGSGDVHHGGR